MGKGKEDHGLHAQSASGDMMGLWRPIQADAVSRLAQVGVELLHRKCSHGCAELTSQTTEVATDLPCSPVVMWDGVLNNMWLLRKRT